MSESTAIAGPTRMERILDGIERVGNKVPNPVLMFVYLIAAIFVISTLLDWVGVSVTETIAEPVPVETFPDYYEDTTYPLVSPTDEYIDDEFDIHEVTVHVEGLLTLDGIRFIFTSFVSNFAGFSVIAVTFIAMMGAGQPRGLA